MSVRLTRRLAFLLVLSSIFLATSTCMPPRQLPPPPSRDLFCTHGNGSKSYPLICVDEQNLTANPKVAIVYDIEPDEHGKPSNRPVTIRWFTQRDAPLSIVFKQDTCVDKLTCDGRGACTASTKRLASGEKSRKCTYNMFANHVKDDDSDIVLNPCCL